jgi:ABC-type dipeptide/oligopeptide/nickel transport system permease component
MVRFLLGKLVMAFLTVFITTILVTLLIHLVPGDPVRIMYAQSQGSTPEQIEEVRRNLGLDKPIYVQYFMYIERLFQGAKISRFSRKVMTYEEMVDLAEEMRQKYQLNEK